MEKKYRGVRGALAVVVYTAKVSSVTPKAASIRTGQPAALHLVEHAGTHDDMPQVQDKCCQHNGQHSSALRHHTSSHHLAGTAVYGQGHQHRLPGVQARLARHYAIGNAHRHIPQHNGHRAAGPASHSSFLVIFLPLSLLIWLIARNMVYYSTAPWPQQVFLAVRDRIAYNVKEYILFLPCVPFGHSSAGHTHL